MGRLITISRAVAIGGETPRRSPRRSLGRAAGTSPRHVVAAFAAEA